MIIAKKYLIGESRWNVKFENDMQTVAHYVDSPVDCDIDAFITEYTPIAQEALDA